MKIFVGRFGHEGNTMSPHLAEYADVLQSSDFCRGQVIIDRFEGTPEYLGGMIACAREHNVEMIPSISTEIAMPRLSTDCLNQCMSQIIEDLTACKDEIDGICFVLHGAGCAVDIDDLETYVLQEFRKVVGPDMPITVPLDLHGNLTQEMLPLADAFFSIKEYPHTDYAECGYLAMKTLIDIIQTGKRPQMALVRIPMLPRSACTLDDPALDINQYIAAAVREHNLIDATFMHGFSSSNLPFTAPSVLVASYENPRPIAEELAQYVWQKRKEFLKEFPKPDEAFRIAEAFDQPGYIVMNEPSDNPGGGAPGDGTFLLQAMLERDLPGSIFAQIYDPEVAQLAIRSGVGSKISCLLGGKVDNIHGAPVELKDAEVLAVADGKMISTSPMMLGVPRNIGPTARIRTGNVEIIVASAQRQTMDDQAFVICGTDASNYRYIALKSNVHFKAYYKNHAALILPVETPGHRSGDPCILYSNVQRPIFPLDEELNDMEMFPV